MAGAHYDYTSAPWSDKDDALFWAEDHRQPNFPLGHDQGCPRRDRTNEQTEHNATMVETGFSSSAIITSACRTCDQSILSDLTNTRTGMAQADQRRAPLAEHIAYADQPARNWGLWDDVYPLQHIMEVDQMFETGSTDWLPPEHNEVEIARLCMEVDAIQAPTVRTDMAIDPQLLEANSIAFVPVQTTADRAQTYMPQAVGLQHLAYLAVLPHSDPTGDSRAMEHNPVMDTGVTEASTRGFHELGPARPEPIQQSHAVSTSEPDHRLATIHKCQRCGDEFARRDGLRHHLEKHTDKAHRHKCEWEGCSYPGGRYPKDLARHDLVHVKPAVPPFACDWAGCIKRFQRRDYLLRHQRKGHADPTVHLEVPTTSRLASSRNLRRMQSRSSGERSLRRTPSSASAATLSSFGSAERSSFSDQLMPPPHGVLADMRRVSPSLGEEVRTSLDDSSSVQSYAPSRLTPRTSQSFSEKPAYSSGRNSFQGA